MHWPRFIMNRWRWDTKCGASTKLVSSEFDLVGHRVAGGEASRQVAPAVGHAL